MRRLAVPKGRQGTIGPLLLVVRVQALRRDLHALEADTRRFVAEVEETKTWSTVHLQQIEGQFRFLWGIYQAHSDVRPLP